MGPGTPRSRHATFKGRDNLVSQPSYLRHSYFCSSRSHLRRYAKLESSGALQHFLQDPEISSTRPFLDDEIQASIDALNTSTAAINKQNEVLTLQCKELKLQLRDDNEAGRRRARALEQLHRRHGLEKQHTSVAV